MKRFLTISLSLLSLTSFSQNYKFNIKFCPLALTDGFSFPTIQGGIEIKLSDRLAWYNEFGSKYRKAYFEWSDTSFIKSSGFKVKSEIRYYFPNQFGEEKKSKLMNGVYLSANVFYNRDFYNSAIRYYANKDTTVETLDNFSVKKKVFGINLAIGKQQIIAKHLVIDFYGGLGIRFRNIENFHREYNPDKDLIVPTVDLTYQGIKSIIDTNEGTHCMPNLTAGFRIGYQF
jgi:hypothetical protein